MVGFTIVYQSYGKPMPICTLPLVTDGKPIMVHTLPIGWLNHYLLMALVQNIEQSAEK
jgi:hypothetical protein